MSIKVGSLMSEDMLRSLWESYMRSIQMQLEAWGRLFEVSTPDADLKSPTFAKSLAPLPEWLEEVNEILDEGKG